jgi:hypothetical protein
MTDITTSQEDREAFERLCWTLRQFVKLVPAMDECRLQLNVGSQSFFVGIESLPEDEAALFAGNFVHALATMFQQAALSHARSVAPGGLTDEQIESVWDKLLRTHGQHSREGRIAIARAILAATPTTVHPTPAIPKGVDAGKPGYLHALIDHLLMPPAAMTESHLRKLHNEVAEMLNLFSKHLTRSGPSAIPAQQEKGNPGVPLAAPRSPKTIERIGLMRAALRDIAEGGDLLSPIARAALNKDDELQEAAHGVTGQVKGGGDA